MNFIHKKKTFSAHIDPLALHFEIYTALVGFLSTAGLRALV